MSTAALRSILPFAGWSADRLDDVEFLGAMDPRLPTPFRITETGTATLAAVGLAVADLWELRTGKRQKIGIDTGHATASLRSTKYLRLDGAKVDTERNAVMADTTTGKKDSRKTSSTFGIRPKPNQMMNSGATAIFGTIWKKTSSG